MSSADGLRALRSHLLERSALFGRFPVAAVCRGGDGIPTLAWLDGVAPTLIDFSRDRGEGAWCFRIERPTDRDHAVTYIDAAGRRAGPLVGGFESWLVTIVQFRRRPIEIFGQA